MNKNIYENLTVPNILSFLRILILVPFVLFVNNNKNVITIVSNIININSILLSVNNVFIISCKFKFNILSKSLLNKKCKFTDV